MPSAVSFIRIGAKAQEIIATSGIPRESRIDGSSGRVVLIQEYFDDGRVQKNDQFQSNPTSDGLNFNCALALRLRNNVLIIYSHPLKASSLSMTEHHTALLSHIS